MSSSSELFHQACGVKEAFVPEPGFEVDQNHAVHPFILVHLSTVRHGCGLVVGQSVLDGRGPGSHRRVAARRTVPPHSGAERRQTSGHRRQPRDRVSPTGSFLLSVWTAALYRADLGQQTCVVQWRKGTSQNFASQ